MDRFYTPVSLATLMVERAANVDDPASLIVDVCVGQGELLKAAQARWPEARLVGVDLDSRAVERLKKARPRWSVARGNFLEPGESPKLVELLKAIDGKVRLALLNPPFSCRGGRRLEVLLNGVQISCSRAMAFVVRAASLVSKDGEVVAVLPAGCVTSEKDETAWGVIREEWAVAVVCRNGRGTFEGCFPRTVVVHLTRRQDLPRREETARSIRRRTPWLYVVIVRGTLSMHQLKAGRRCGKRTAFVHTTDLAGGFRAERYETIRSEAGRRVTTPAVLLARVGLPSREKIVYYDGKVPLALSDCVIALACPTQRQARLLRACLLESWEHILEAYGGTCAPFLTMRRLRESLVGMGVLVREAESMGAGVTEPTRAASSGG